MATKTPIVGTLLATEGIQIKDGKEAFIAQTAEEIVTKTVEVLNNPKRGERLAEAAYKLVSKEFNWKKISLKLDRVYKEVGSK